MSTTPHASDETQGAIPAATVIIFRNGQENGAPEFLMVVRSRTMSFAGGAAVFPGGRVDPADFELAETLPGDLPVDELAHRVAAVRETLEETGLAIGVTGEVDGDRAAQARAMLLDSKAIAPVLQAMDWQIDPDTIVPFARWFPKNEKLSRIFDARFYLADVGTGAVDIAVDATENTKLFWITAQGALDAAEAGELSLIYPTRRNLERLATFPDYITAIRQCAEIPVRTITPVLEEHDGAKYLTIPDDAGYPVTRERLEAVLRG